MKTRSQSKNKYRTHKVVRRNGNLYLVERKPKKQ